MIYDTLVSLGTRNPGHIIVEAADGFEAAFLAWLRCQPTDRIAPPLVRGSGDRFYVDGALVIVHQA